MRPNDLCLSEDRAFDRILACRRSDVCVEDRPKHVTLGNVDPTALRSLHFERVDTPLLEATEVDRCTECDRKIQACNGIDILKKHRCGRH